MLLDHQEILVRLVQLAIKVELGIQDQMGLMEQTGQQEFLICKDLLVKKICLDYQKVKVFQNLLDQSTRSIL